MPSNPVSVSRLILILVLSSVFFAGQAQTTSWRGTSSIAWGTASNWTNGVPNATVDAIVGDANFTGSFQPTVTATSNCRSLTVGGGAANINLTVNAALRVDSDVNIATLGTLTHTNNTITVRGNWSVTGTYNATVNTATVVFAGTAQAINNATNFRRLTINSGSTTSLGTNITVSNAFVVGGIFDPVSASNIVTLTGATFTVNALGRIRVHAATFSGNYSVDPTLNARSIVDYASPSINQTIATLNYGTLTISGGSLKTLAGNTTLQSTSGTGGNVNVNAGVLDLGAFTLNRNAAGGGTFTVSNGAQLNIGGTNSFPINYNTTTLGASSTILYGGDNQTITSKTYGNLILSGVSGDVVKVFPATAMTIAGSLSSVVGTATSVTYNANAAITITGNVSIGTATTFNGGAATHIIAGNWTNAGTFNGNTGTVRFNGATRIISGAGAQNFNNLTVAGAGVTCSSANVTLTGNLATTGSGTFTHNASSTLTFAGTTKTIGGTGINLFNVMITGSMSTTASFTIGGNLTVNGSFNATAGTITFNAASPVIAGSGSTTFFGMQVAGSLSTAISFSMRSNLSGAGKLTASAGTISFIGTTTVSGTHDLFNATVNGTRLQLGANSALSVAGSFTITAGTFNTTSTTPNTLIYNGAGSQNIAAATYNNLVLATGGTKTATGAISARGNFDINTGVTFNASSFTHTLSGNWNNQGSFIPSTGTITFNGTLNTTTTGVTTFNILTLNKSTATTTVTLNNNVTATTVNMTNGRMLTGSNTITITGTRTGNAVILGNITRTHAFAANTAYAFESSFNTINFTSISGGSITSVTVTVLSAPVLDFPSINSISRSYNIAITNTGSYVATLRLHYDDTELNGNVEANLSLWQFLSGTWTSQSKTSSDVNNNWAQRTNLSNITGRWTLDDGGTTHVWKGTTNSAWATASNWKAGVVPLANDNILIGTETFTNQPSITTAITVKSIALGSVKAVNLTVGGGAGSLTVTGNVSGDWLADQAHTIGVGNRTLNIGGDLILSNGSAARKIQLTLSTGTVNVGGNLNHSGGGSIVFSGSGNLGIGLDYNYSGGVFTASTGTVTYNGSADQVIASGITYNHLTVSKSSGTASLGGTSTVNGNILLSNASDVALNAQLNVTGNVTVSPGTTLNANNAIFNVGGNWNLAGTFNANTGSVVFNGSGNQNVVLTTFNDVVINKPTGTLNATNDLTINGDVTIHSGTFNLGNFSMNRSAPGGTFSLHNGTTLLVGGTANFPANFDSQSLADNSTVNYNGTTQTIAPVTYGNLVLSNSGAKSFVSGTPTEAKNLTINATAVLPNAATLKVNGNLTTNAAFNIAAGGVVEFSGNAAQTISGTSTTDFADVVVSNTSSPGVSIESNQNLRGVLTLSPNATIDADGSANSSILRVMSTADNPTQDAAIGALPTGAAVTGKVTVQRYMSIEGPSGGRIYRYVSSPIQNATVADLQNEIPITGAFTGSSPCSGCNAAPSMYAYDETVTTGGLDGGYFAFPLSSNTETFQTGRGYSLFVRGNIIPTALWDLRGPINSGAINLPVSFTSSGTTANDGWNLVGNPYPSTIDWDAPVGWAKTNINGTIYVRDNAGVSGQYATWNGVVGTNGGSQYIAAGQAFWVKAGSVSPSLSIDENAKVPGTQTSFFREAAPDNMMRVTLSQGNIRDEAVIHFRMDATGDFDDDADAIKIPNGGFNLSTQLVGKDKLAINSLDLSNCSISVPLSLDNVSEGSYSLSFDTDSFTSSTAITLTDNFTGATVDTRLNHDYTFSVTSDPASQGNTRFVLGFSLQPAPMDHSVSALPVCPGVDAQIELAQTSELVNYQVTVNNVVVLLERGNGSSQYVTLPAAMLSSGENSVHVTASPFNSCGTLTETLETLTVGNVSEPKPGDVQNICRQGAATLTASGAITGEEYHWYASATDNIVLSKTENYITPVLTGSQTYYVSIERGDGCESERVAVKAEVINYDDPVIIMIGDKLSVDNPGRKQWYLNGVILANDTTSSIKPGESGVYSVTVSTGSCMAEATYSYITTGIEPEQVSSISVYPNPVTDHLHFSQSESAVINVSLENSIGQLIGKFALNKTGTETTGTYNMTSLPGGLYFVIIESRESTVRVKVVKK